MGEEDVLSHWVQVSKVLSITAGPLAVVLSAPRLASTARGAAGEEVIPGGAAEVAEGGGVGAEEGRLSATVGAIALPGPASILGKGLAEEAGELARATPDVGREAVASGVSVSANLASAVLGW